MKRPSPIISRLILLWMGSWKNGLSHYTPRWVKIDQDRFPRVMTPEGRSLEILTTLSQANRDADAKAFVALMKHIREVDSKEHTVIAVQVENEIGVISIRATSARRPTRPSANRSPAS